MIEIADASEVSRATLYNHYRDKNAVLMALITVEVERLVEAAQRAGTPADALELLSREIFSRYCLAGDAYSRPRSVNRDHVASTESALPRSC
jgi:TetR/AcrR family transcriptional regulator, transcriptional repressor of aconitase